MIHPWFFSRQRFAAKRLSVPERCCCLATVMNVIPSKYDNIFGCILIYHEMRLQSSTWYEVKKKPFQIHFPPFYHSSRRALPSSHGMVPGLLRLPLGDAVPRLHLLSAAVAISILHHWPVGSYRLLWYVIWFPCSQPLISPAGLDKVIVV